LIETGTASSGKQAPRKNRCDALERQNASLRICETNVRQAVDAREHRNEVGATLTSQPEGNIGGLTEF
jgi:hypothetical protein